MESDQEDGVNECSQERQESNGSSVIKRKTSGKKKRMHSLFYIFYNKFWINSLMLNEPKVSSFFIIVCNIIL